MCCGNLLYRRCVCVCFIQLQNTHTQKKIQACTLRKYAAHKHTPTHKIRPYVLNRHTPLFPFPTIFVFVNTDGLGDGGGGGGGGLMTTHSFTDVLKMPTVDFLKLNLFYITTADDVFTL